jgi:hypothetical protein
MTAPFRCFVVLLLALIQPFASLFHEVTGLGLSVPEFARDGDEVLRAAGYAFSIWGVIYAACMAYGVYQAWPRRQPSALEDRLGWPSAVAFACCTAWVIIATLDLKAASIAVIIAGALALIIPLVTAQRLLAGVSGRQRWLVAWPLGALAGWLTVASAINVVTVLAAQGYLSDPATADLAAYGAVLVAAAIAVGVVLRTGLIPYALTVGWGLVAVAVAEAGRHPDYATAAGAAFLVLLAAAALRRRGAGLR